GDAGDENGALGHERGREPMPEFPNKKGSSRGRSLFLVTPTMQSWNSVVEFLRDWEGLRALAA
ncbi:MAG: hypothetical protein OER77_16530, partial [Myxococcales bacterium]|nr:hypothetical protein [Myxococcales bacterium]